MVSKFKFPLTFNTGVEHPSGSGSGLRLSAERIRRAFVLGGRGNSSNAAEGPDNGPFGRVWVKRFYLHRSGGGGRY